MQEGYINCKFCGASNKDTAERCFSCNAPLPKRSQLSDKDKESLTNYIKSINQMLKSSQEKGDNKLIPIFVILSIIAIGSIILFYFIFFADHRTLFWWISIGWSIVLFIVFGYYVTLFQNKSMENEFKTKIRFEIKEYLNQMYFTEADFKTTASETLKKEDPLIKFLPDL